jgi:xanthine dehydrogenase accessory factor
MPILLSRSIVIRGGGDIGSGVAHSLHRCGFQILILEVESPLVVRRTVSFARAVIDGEAVVEGIRAVRVVTKDEMRTQWQQGNIAVMVDSTGAIMKEVHPAAVIDATLAKSNTGMHRGMAPITIGLGPGFQAGGDVDVVVETNRGHNLGRLICEGFAEPDTGAPAPVGGYGRERVLRAPCGGVVRHVLDISDLVKEGDVICRVGDQPVRAPFDGMVRGLIMNGSEVAPGMKIGDVDPRPTKELCHTISDKARAIGRAVLEAVLYMQQRQQLL